jgi:hypothetical protein
VVSPVVEAMLAKLPGAVRAGVRAVVANMPDATAVDFLRSGWNVTVDSAEIVQRMQRQRAAKEAGHQGGVKTARKNRMGLLPAVDPAGKKWKPDFKAPLNRAVFPKWGKVPVYVPPLNRNMSPSVRGVIIAIGDVVDHLGDFVVPRAWLAEQIGTSERKAYAALQTLRAAGLIEPRIQGDRNQATVWRYAEVAKVDTVHARKVLQAARAAAAEKAGKIHQKAEVRA